jgi:hypothetical protein
MNTDVTCPKCGSNALKKIGWLWILSAIWLVSALIELLLAALVPATGRFRSHRILHHVALNLLFAVLWAVFLELQGPRWRCTKCKHMWR